MENQSHTTLPQTAAEWRGIGEHQHFVQFYDEDDALVESVVDFLRGGLRVGAACIVIATRDHRVHIAARLRARGFNLDEAREAGQYIALDAPAILARLLVDGRPNLERFEETIGPIVAGAELKHPHVLAFGEMVGLLSQDGKHDLAIELERLWNQLAIRHAFSLFCAYARNAFSAHDRQAFEHICREHASILAA